MTTAHTSMLDSVGRARHSLQQMHDPAAALVTVHGICPRPGCGAMNVVSVRADTTSITCRECGTTFEV